MLRLGIVGLPNVGKSTLFNALTSSKAAAAENYPFCTVEPNVGVVEVPDPRLDRLFELVRPKKKVPAVVEFVDIAGLVRGASAGDKAAQLELVVLERVLSELDAGRGAREAGETDDAVRFLRQLGLLTAKPILYAANVNEDDLAAGGGAWIGRLRAAVQSHHEEAEIVPFSAKFEAELAELSGGERAEYLASAGVREPGLDRLIHAGYHLLGLQTFFTVGENEVRAWTMARGGTAFDAAGEIHSDLQRGFIRAETVAYDEFVRVGSYKSAREQGLVRSEGRDYVVQDGDILLFRFNI